MNFGDKVKAKLKDILHWYKFRPRIEPWFCTDFPDSSSSINWEYDEPWYGHGGMFKRGFFILLQFKLFTFHCRVSWWKIRL